jgi:hypothetical protein
MGDDGEGPVATAVPFEPLRLDKHGMSHTAPFAYKPCPGLQRDRRGLVRAVCLTGAEKLPSIISFRRDIEISEEGAALIACYDFLRRRYPSISYILVLVAEVRFSPYSNRLTTRSHDWFSIQHQMVDEPPPSALAL